MRRHLAIVLWALLGATTAGHAGEGPPRIVQRGDGTVVVEQLPAILGQEVVRPHLGTGLTTTLLVEAVLIPREGLKRPGAGRVEIRFELWDEVYLVTVIGGAGTPRAARPRSFTELEAWWQGLALELAEGPLPAAAGPWTARVTLALLPFSHSEQEDTQRWLSRSLGSPTAPVAAPNPGPSPPLTTQPTTNPASVLDLLLATSIRRPRVMELRWSLPVTTREAPP